MRRACHSASRPTAYQAVSKPITIAVDCQVTVPTARAINAHGSGSGEFSSVTPHCRLTGPQRLVTSANPSAPRDVRSSAASHRALGYGMGTGLLVTPHYFYRPPGRGAAAVAWREERPDLVAAAADPSVASAISRAVERDAGIDALIGELRPLLGKP